MLLRTESVSCTRLIRFMRTIADLPRHEERGNKFRRR